ncbi:ATP-dependent zinc protease [Alteromonas flava]|uniref:ATP-dependent zinc protease family protein n=1 Tax=Alteromonas flava TaxID=2048003 RepID=UPI000C28C0F4|nr:ATP-dependent zinc protease [Alteromonas flava]
MRMVNNKHIVGSLELCNLPELTIENLNIRVDTGAATSSLHVDNLEEFQRDGEEWVSFDIHPNIHNVDEIVRREAKVSAVKNIKSSTATRERRYVIETDIVIAGMRWQIQLTLTDRSEMTYLMLLGREAMSGRLVVDPEHEYLLTQPE